MKGISVEKTGLVHLLNALETLKREGYENQDARRIWCPDWIKCVLIALLLKSSC